jgi:tetratricopeptide (TPR) repeat protein
MAQSRRNIIAAIACASALLLLAVSARADEPAPAAQSADWSLPAEQAQKAGPEIAGKIAQWASLPPEERMRVLVQCIGILGGDADSLCLKVLRHETAPALLKRASAWFIDNGRKEHVPLLLEIAGERKDSAIVFAAATLAAQYGETDKAVALLEAAQPADASNLLLLADLCEKRGDFEKAEAAYKSLLALEPANTRFAVRYAGMLVRKDDIPRALEVLLEIRRANEDSVEAFLDYVAALREFGLLQVIDMATEGARRFKDYRFPYMAANFARDVTGNPKAAMARYLDALPLAAREPELSLVASELAGLLVESADFEKEYADLRKKADKALSDGDFRAVVYLNLVIAYVAVEKRNSGDADAACKAVWGNAEMSHVTFDDLPSLLGGLLERAGAWETAAEIYQAAIERDESRPDYRKALGRCYLEEGKRDDALAAWRALVEGERGADPKNYFILVDTLMANNLKQEAEDESRKAVARFPEEIDLVLQRLKILVENGKAEDAVQLITDTLRLVQPERRAAGADAIVMTLPPDADARKLIEVASRALAKALLDRADALAAEGKKDEALAACRKAVEISRDEAIAGRARELMKRLEAGDAGEAGGND